MKHMILAALLGLSGPVAAKTETATFAGGCFWCMQPPFEQLKGVKKVLAGYTDGTGANPTYEDYGDKGYTEGVQVTYDPQVVSYAELCDVFWHQINPTDKNGQFADRGPHYRSGIFPHNAAQRKIAEASKKALSDSKRFDKPIVIPIIDYKNFVAAEDYHQDYHDKNPLRYSIYRQGSGRDAYLKEAWKPMEKEYKRPSDKEIKAKLDPLQCHVTQEDGTEPPFDNKYWNNHDDGIYVDVVSGEPLFSSKEKYDSGTGWPSFFKPLEKNNLVEKIDGHLGMTRTEVRSRHGNSHLGHVFPDGPAPTGLRYCMNSASLRFIPKKDLAKEGYGEYEKLFK